MTATSRLAIHAGIPQPPRPGSAGLAGLPGPSGLSAFLVIPLLMFAMLLSGCGDDASSDPSAEADQDAADTSFAMDDEPADDDMTGRIVTRNASGPSGTSRPSRPSRSSSGAPADVTMLVAHKLHDPGLNNMHSHTLLVPKGWKVEGGLQRMPPALYNIPVILDLKITAPDGRRARFLPGLSFEYAPGQAQPWQPLQSGNIFMPMPQSLGQWIVQQANLRPEEGVTNVQLISEETIPAITQQLRQQYQQMAQTVAQTNQMGASMGMGAWFDTQAQSIRISYTKDDQQWEETIYASWMAIANLQNGQNYSGFWSILSMFSVREKPGVDPTNDPIFRTIFQSLRTTPRWQQEMHNYYMELARIRNKGARDRQQQFARTNKIIQENNAAINDMIYEGWKGRQASSDRMQQQTVDTIREVTPYQTPDGNTVRLPSHYNHVYSDGQGNYLLHNDANYNPNTDPNFNNHNWQTIEQAR